MKRLGLITLVLLSAMVECSYAHAFTRIGAEELRNSGVTDTTEFIGFAGAWAEPDSEDGKKGMVWSDTARDESGRARKMDQRDADTYCKRIGAELPSGYDKAQNGKNGFPNQDSDFVRLLKHMIITQTFLPALNGNGNSFWSSSVPLDYSSHVYSFRASYGVFSFYLNSRAFADQFARCVVARR